jgi:hypothetical protein
VVIRDLPTAPPPAAPRLPSKLQSSRNQAAIKSQSSRTSASRASPSLQTSIKSQSSRNQVAIKPHLRQPRLAFPPNFNQVAIKSQSSRNQAAPPPAAPRLPSGSPRAADDAPRQPPGGLRQRRVVAPRIAPRRTCAHARCPRRSRRAASKRGIGRQLGRQSVVISE